jgi:hypothetical protein
MLRIKRKIQILTLKFNKRPLIARAKEMLKENQTRLLEKQLGIFVQ